MFGSKGSYVGGHTTRIDNLPPSLSSSDMLKECALDNAIKVERISKFMKL
jgi:hypothetical protein